MKHGVGTKTEWYSGGVGRRFRVWYRFNRVVKRRDLGPCSRDELDPDYPTHDGIIKHETRNRVGVGVRDSGAAADVIDGIDLLELSGTFKLKKMQANGGGGGGGGKLTQSEKSGVNQKK